MTQLGLFDKPERGGRRDGAGRKRMPNRHDPDHRPRPEHKQRFPLHVVYRVCEGVPRLRKGLLTREKRRAGP